MFTMFCYANLGVSKNTSNPFYKMTGPSNPSFNTQEKNFIDYDLVGFLYPKHGLHFGNVGLGSDGHIDFLATPV